MNKNTLLQQLPEYKDEWVVVHEDQEVGDIIQEMLTAHLEFAGYYDKIALYFDDDSPERICDNLYRFCKTNISYREETEKKQTTALPSGILTRGFGDCKHYASFCGGVLGALTRVTGKKIDWHYCFASYDIFSPTPYHVFIIVTDRGKEIWIDPTPGSEGKTPVWVINRKPKHAGMPLVRNIAGANEEMMVSEDHISDIPADQVAPIQLLQYYGVLSPTGAFNEARYNYIVSSMPVSDSTEIINAAEYLVYKVGGSAIGNFWDDAFKYIQHNAAILGMQVPRASFLGLVAINAFGYATKLKRAIDLPDVRAKLIDLWERVGGKFSKLEEYILSGAKKKALLKGFNDDGYAVGSASVGVAVAAPAIIASAALIVAAIMPVISQLLARHKESPAPHDDIPLDPNTGLPVGYDDGSPISFIKNNPVIFFGAAALLAYALYKYY